MQCRVFARTPHLFYPGRAEHISFWSQQASWMSWHSQLQAQCCELHHSSHSEAGGFQASRACRARDASPDVASTRSSTTPPRRSQAAQAAHPVAFRPVLVLCSGILATPGPGRPMRHSQHRTAQHGTAWHSTA